MLNSYIILPMFAMYLLSLYTLQRMFRTRVRLAKEGKVDTKYYNTYQVVENGQPEPTESRVLGRHFSNLYEAPVLFYTVCLAALATENANTAFQILAWLYVLSRLAHSYVHLGANRLMPRIYAYMGSWAILTGLWLVLLIAIL